MTMGELSRVLLVSNGNSTTVVDRLEQDGLVKRTPSETDLRTSYVTLTPEGLEMFEDLATEHEAEINGLFANLNEADLEALNDILKRAGVTK